MPKNIGLKMTGLVVACALSLSAANMPMIGMVSSDPGQAGVRIDGERVSSNATLFEGSEVTSPGYSRLQLNSGTRVNLGANSVVRVYANHASLEGGTSEIQGGLGYAIDARSLRIEAAESGSIVRVRLDGDRRVLVSAMTAPANVWNSEGLLVARVLPQIPMSFLPQAAASNAFSDSGCVVNKLNVAVLVDQTGNQVFELRSAVSGADPSKFIGKRAVVTGTLNPSYTPVAGATQVVGVSSISLAKGGDCAAMAARIGGTVTGATVAGASAAPTTSNPTPGGAVAGVVNPAILAGVIVGAVGTAIVSTMAVSGVFNNQATSP
jgi:hypothetical protein